MLENGKQKIWIVHITPCAPTVSALGFNPVTWSKWRPAQTMHARVGHWFSMPSSAVYLVSLCPSSLVHQTEINNMQFSISKIVLNFHVFIITKFLTLFRKRWSHIEKVIQNNLDNSSILLFFQIHNNKLWTNLNCGLQVHSTIYGKISSVFLY